MRILGCFLTIALLLSGCQRPAAPPQKPSTSTALFEEVAVKAGVRFRHDNGARGKFRFIESNPGGCALFDYDNDGWLDIFLVQSGSSDPAATVKDRPHCGLFHNRGDGTFTEVTAGSGFDKDLGYGHGVAVGDIDNDGFDDVFVTSYGGNHLFHNERGTGKFTDITAAWGLDKLHSTGMAMSAAFGDYDSDGKLDLYVTYYALWTHARDRVCHVASGSRDYCRPEFYDPDVSQLFHNVGGRFVDVSQAAGITKKQARGLAVAWFDYHDDGKPDILVANDLTPNLLWRNNGNGTFTDVAVESGCAYATGGALMAAMGIGLADYDHSGRESIYMSNFSEQPKSLFKNQGGGLFEDVSQLAGLAQPQMRYLSFGCEFLDFNADGWPDLFSANGHVQLNAATSLDGVTYKQPKQLFQNLGDGTFKEVTPGEGAGELAEPRVARGVAVGDVDNDGRLDALFSNQNDDAQLFKNRDPSGNHWLAFKTIGTKSNRDGFHTKITVHIGDQTRVGVVRAGSSYLSVSDRRVYFGLGAAQKVDKVEVVWPSGLRETLTALAADRVYTLTEGKGAQKTP